MRTSGVKGPSPRLPEVWAGSVKQQAQPGLQAGTLRRFPCFLPFIQWRRRDKVWQKGRHRLALTALLNGMTPPCLTPQQPPFLAHRSIQRNGVLVPASEDPRPSAHRGSAGTEEHPEGLCQPVGPWALATDTRGTAWGSPNTTLYRSPTPSSFQTCGRQHRKGRAPFMLLPQAPAGPAGV